jgi:hypothetical protein
VAFVRNDDLALVVLGALVVVVACSAEGRNSYADTEVAELRLHRSAEAWAPVALPEVLVTVLSADGARLPWHRDASALFAVAAACVPKHQKHLMQSHAEIF